MPVVVGEFVRTGRTRPSSSMSVIAAPCVVTATTSIRALAAASASPARNHDQIASTSKCG